jgi:ribonuclease HII
MIVGIDEVGRGAWAGPLVVGAVLLGGSSIEGLTDSKKLTKRQRELLDLEIRQKALGVGLGWVSAKHIDQIGLSQALKLASQRAIAHIRHEYAEIIIDGTFAFLDDARVTVMPKADLLVPSVSAASIVAKVARDNYMRHIDDVFPGYKFSGHVGYGTAAHRKAIDEQGVSPLHRLSYAPLAQYQKNEGRARPAKNLKVWTSKQIGDAAETKVVAHLKKTGHEILARNWRTKFCEIDIVSRVGDTVYFTEVKHRKADMQGGGLAAITPRKQKQMAFAAEFYATSNKLSSSNLLLAAASTTGVPPRIVDYLELR